MLNSVVADGPAESGGLMLGDILVTLDGEAVQSPDDLAILLQSERVGKEVSLRIIRGGQAQVLAVEIGVREE